ncbi:MAG: CBS domain-containing protein [Planctomycetes bacterium]|nr:CBS domain-containing protein [Planctomycetota bacterium]
MSKVQIATDQQDAPTPSVVLEAMRSKRAADAMQFGTPCIEKDDSVYRAISIIIEEQISGLPVVDNGQLVGIISDKDLLMFLFGQEFLYATVKDFMTGNVVTFEVSDSLSAVCNCLATHSFRRIPILFEGRPIGALSRADLIRFAAQHLFSPTDAAAGEPLKKESPVAMDVMRGGVLTVRTETPMSEIAQVLASKRVSGLPVVDDYMNLLGIVSEKDVLASLYAPNGTVLVARDLMTREVVSFDIHDDLFDICDVLVREEFRRVPILDQGKLAGIISRTDIMQHIVRNKSYGATYNSPKS